MDIELKHVDFLVIGAGVAGTFFALLSGERGKVLLLCKSSLKESNSCKAQGGIAVVISHEDSVESHIEDTLKKGCGLSREDVVRFVAETGPSLIERLSDMGLNFDFEEVADEGEHSFRRILRMGGEAIGETLMEHLHQRARQNPGIEIKENCFVFKLLIENRRCTGAWAFNRETGKLLLIRSKICILTTGGIGQIYGRTTNSITSTGDGAILGYDGGCEIMGPEFIQFHPTALYNPRSAHPSAYLLVSEEVRRAGGILRNNEGKAFMEDVHPLKDIAPRDIITRAIFREMRMSDSPHVYLDISEIDNFTSRFPIIYQHCKSAGIDMKRELIPVTPTAHYTIGGIRTDNNGETGIPGLFALGEVANPGIHGANRLPSNSLLESMVLSYSAMERGMEYIKILPSFQQEGIPPFTATNININKKDVEYINKTKYKLQEIMWQSAGIIRDGRRLQIGSQWLLFKEEEFYQRFPYIKDMENFVPSFSDIRDTGSLSLATLLELKNMIIYSRLILRASLEREESRGTHYRIDFPETDPEDWRGNLILRKNLPITFMEIRT